MYVVIYVIHRIQIRRWKRDSKCFVWKCDSCHVVGKKLVN